MAVPEGFSTFHDFSKARSLRGKTVIVDKGVPPQGVHLTEPMRVIQVKRSSLRGIICILVLAMDQKDSIELLVWEDTPIKIVQQR
ncbi:MAG: hypothetical protein Q8N16_01740 [bacterium]|nr:hypothetical protein [bacterium]